MIQQSEGPSLEKTLVQLTHELRNAIVPIGSFLRQVDTAEAERDVQDLHASARRSYERVVALLREAP